MLDRPTLRVREGHLPSGATAGGRAGRVGALVTERSGPPIATWRRTCTDQVLFERARGTRVTDRIKVFGGNGNPDLVREICDYLDVPVGKVDIHRFSNENLFVQVLENVREKDVFVVQPFCSPVHENIMELLIMMDALRSASAARITAVIPYFSYARSDKKDAPRISIAGRLMADLLVTAGAERVLTMNLHKPQVHGFFSVPTDHLFAAPILCNYFRERDLTNTVAVASDAGHVKEAA